MNPSQIYPAQLDRLYIGIDSNARVIVDKDGKVLATDLVRWKAFKAAGGEVEHVGALPPNTDLDLVAMSRGELEKR